MATLPVIDRIKISKGLMRYWSSNRETVQDMTPTDLFDAITATDQWIDDNQASFIAALPEPFKSNSSALQKTLVFVVVAAMRVSQAFLVRLIGSNLD